MNFLIARAGTDPRPYSPLNAVRQRFFWLGASAFAATLLLVPLLFLFSGLSGEGNEAWQHLRDTVLGNYTLNTLVLIGGVGGFTLLIGASLALLVSRFDFPLRKFFTIALLMPLALPTYIAAYAFAGLFDYAGPLHAIGKSLGSDQWHANIMHRGGLIFVLSMVLYPYVYATARVALQSRYNSYIESARSLGLKPMRVLFKVILPLLRPALAGGVFLVMMEVLNDYGAMKYFGIPTFTMGIFNAWFAMGDLSAAVRLALMLFALVAVLSGLESWYNRRYKVNESHRSSVLRRTQLRGGRAALATSYAGLIFFVAFIAPVFYLFWLLVGANLGRSLAEWPQLATNSFIGALSGTAAVLLIVLFTQFVRLLVRNRAGFLIGKSISIGYTLPGAIIAVGVLLFSSWLDVGLPAGWALTGSFVMLVFAYTIRFAGVAYQPLHAESEKRSARMFEAAQSLRMRSVKVLREIYVPLSTPGIRLAAILVIIDILKELPLTLILRPFNFSTLATKAFEYADDEMLSRAALPAISVILVGLIPVLLLNRILRD